MPAQKRAPCQVCQSSESKYTCAQCKILYCSISCYKEHKATSCQSQSAQPTSLPQVLDPGPSKPAAAHDDAAGETQHTELRPLTSLKWPYVPEESAYPDPLRRDDPKPLQLPQYEAIATSPAVRRALASHPQLPALLRSLDQVRGPEREEALEHALGVAPPNPREARTEEDTHALRELAEAVEAAVRGGKQDVLGLDWGD